MMLKPAAVHPEGEATLPSKRPLSDRIEVATYGGKLFVEWDPDAAVTPVGPLPFFIEFLKLGDRFKPWVDDCPLTYLSPNAPEKIDVLGSLFLSVLSGHTRYSHMTALLGDGINTKLLGMNKTVSDDSARRGLKKIPEKEGTQWSQKHLQSSYELLLQEPWIMDCDVTVKPLYGRQEGAKKGYNPHKPGRPLQTYHSYTMANLRLVLDVEVQAGNQSNASYSAPGLLNLLSRLPKACWPECVRGDCDWGSGPIMEESEAVGMPYLFKLKQSKNVKNLIVKHHGTTGWTLFKPGYEFKEETLRLSSWSTSRRVILVRRQIKKGEEALLLESNHSGQQSFSFIEKAEDMKLYEYSTLITSLEQESVSIVQPYRDRADCENIFDEIKNQWGWGGYTTQALNSCQLMARTVALIYNWWSLFVRMANPDAEGHQEAITSRPLLLTGVGRLTKSGHQKTITITSHHAKSGRIRELFQNLSQFFSDLKAIAPQLNSLECWRRILAKVVEKILPLGGNGPPVLPASAT